LGDLIRFGVEINGKLNCPFQKGDRLIVRVASLRGDGGLVEITKRRL